MNKRHLHNFWRQLHIINQWYFLIAAIIVGVIFIFAYRQNNLTAIRLRDKVLQVDKNNGDVETALRDLRIYTYRHMNANLRGGPGSIYPPIQLKDRYDRLVAGERSRVDQANAQAIQDSKVACSGNAERLLCEQRYTTGHTAVPQPIPDSLYKFDFVAPPWSPDLAGWSLVFCFVLMLLFIIRFIAERWLRYSISQN